MVALNYHEGGKLRPGPSRWVEIVIEDDFDNTEQSTGFSFPSTCVCLGAYLQVTTADASQTLDVGTGGTSNDPDGLLDGVSVNATGVVKGTLADGAATLGALLRTDESGGDLVPEPAVDVGGDEVTFTGSDTTNTFRGSIWIEYLAFDAD